jgi:hypothetical protein
MRSFNWVRLFSSKALALCDIKSKPAMAMPLIIGSLSGVHPTLSKSNLAEEELAF